MLIPMDVFTKWKLSTMLIPMDVFTLDCFNLPDLRERKQKIIQFGSTASLGIM